MTGGIADAPEPWPWLSTEAAGKAVGLPTARLARLAWSGDLIPAARSGHRCWWDLADLRHQLAERECRSDRELRDGDPGK